MSEGDAQPWRVHGERTICDSRWVRLSLVDMEPRGSERFEHSVVRLFRAVVAAVVNDSDQVLMMCLHCFVPGRFGWEARPHRWRDGAGYLLCSVWSVRRTAVPVT